MPSGESETNFGLAVSISGDTIVVGAPGEDYYSRDPMHKGAAFVFTKPNGGWVSTSAAAKLTALAGDIGDEFGRAVAVSGDTIVIAAPGDRNHRRKQSRFGLRVYQAIERLGLHVGIRQAGRAGQLVGVTGTPETTLGHRSRSRETLSLSVRRDTTAAALRIHQALRRMGQPLYRLQAHPAPLRMGQAVSGHRFR